MIHPEAEYIGLGFLLEKSPSVPRSRSILSTIIRKIESEHIDERADARYLVERGRKEARETRGCPPCNQNCDQGDACPHRTN